MTPRPALLALAVAGCQAPASDSPTVSTTPGISTVPDGSTTDPPAAASSSTGSTSTTTSGAASSGDTGTGETTTFVPDLGDMPDFSDGNPIGCQGKIDFLFVISADGNMGAVQVQLIDAFPDFITTIESKFADFDYHIMVIAGDDEWGAYWCTQDCPVLDCKIGDDCCEWPSNPDIKGDPCCQIENYPCDKLDLVKLCDTTFGAGEVFPVGWSASNVPCPIDGGRRYMIKGQTDLPGTFACAAKIGASGGGKLGQALTAAMQKDINNGGCNHRFLREDALLMVTLIGGVDEGGGHPSSEGWPADWAKAVLDAKHGDPESVVMLSIGRKDPDCMYYDGICQMVQMFPYRLIEYVLVDNYGPAFDKATDLVDTACAGFVPPG